LVLLLSFLFEMLCQLLFIIEDFLELRISIAILLLVIDAGLFEPIDLRLYYFCLIVFNIGGSLLIDGSTQWWPLMRKGTCGLSCTKSTHRDGGITSQESVTTPHGSGFNTTLSVVVSSHWTRDFRGGSHKVTLSHRDRCSLRLD
jgi:hypothetical protein